MATKKNNKQAFSDIISNDNEIADLKLDSKDVKPVKLEESTLVKVKSNVFGTLYYRNSKTGEETEWSMCGEIQSMTIGDLRAMKATQSSFFSNQWVVILGLDDGEDSSITPAEVYKTLGITKYYLNLIEPSNFEQILSWDVNTIATKVSFLSEGAKRNLVVALNEYIEKGLLDSITRIKAFEKALQCDLARV